MVRTLQRANRRKPGAFAPIERPRVVERLAASAKHPITLLIAPAGYGKSVALRQYLETSSDPRVRFTLRTEHSTLLGFLRGLTEALGESAPHAITALAGAYERNTASPKRAADLARWMHAHLESFSGIVAIDDFHLADGEPEVARFLTALIERTKARIRWILASRSTAELPVGTWLAYRDADLPIGEHDLRFILEEARAAADRHGLAIRDDELAELLALTEGWPAAMAFALRTSTRSSELWNVSALTREMIYRLLAEQVYSALDEDERGLLELAAALPVIDVSVLERAGFDRAFTIVERLRERTAFIYEESRGIYQCHDLFREFVRHQTALNGKRSLRSVHERAARALEASGDIEQAIASYITASSFPDVVRLLERHGFDLLERARADLVAQAIESLDEKSRRQNAFMLGLQGALHATAGKFARAESLFRRALARAADDRDLVATVSLRLASMMANQGQDITELLNAVGHDAEQSAARRAEALSLIAGQRAVIGDTAAARSASSEAEALMDEIDSDTVRAKVLHHVGIAFHHLRMAARAYDVLTLSSELASELHLYSIVSRANAVLSNLTLHEEDDVLRQLHYAELAAQAATKGGDAFALQTALLQMLSARMRQGDIQRSIELEQRLATIRKSDLALRYLTLFRARRLAWEGRFGEAQQLVGSCWAELPFDFDRIICGSQYGLFLALDGQRELSSSLIREMLGSISSAASTGLFRIRSVAIAKTFCVLAEAINGRITNAERILRALKADGDAVVANITRAADRLLRRLRDRGHGNADWIIETVEELAALGYADVALLLRAVDRALNCGQLELFGKTSLTHAELEILRQLAEGLVPKEIAARDGRSIHTIRVHIANAIAKLGCHGRLDALRMAQRMGLISL